ncbi:hypothetical protein BJY52DRAFT_1220779 [Lactarius psammicola]|nr:hypothetical protein BJY52DRAFT_1220779 [Lactarius psammicola]
MPLNYSKWEQIELSDDSDIESHPNVDKKSLIQSVSYFINADTHEKRKARNHRIEQLGAEVACNDVLLTRLRAIQPKLAQSDSSYFSSELDRLRTNPSPEAPRTNATKPVPYDEMILTLLQTIAKEAREQAESDTGKLDKLLEERLDFHVNKLSSVTEERRKERDTLLKEKSEHITMDDLYVGVESKYVPAKPEPAPVTTKVTSKGTPKTTHIKVPSPASTSSAPSKSTARAPDDNDDEGVEIPHMTPSLEEFAKLPLWDFEKLWLFIQNHREVVVHGASDALLVAGFKAQRAGKSMYAKQCVHQSLVLKYSKTLGKDGVQLFFKRVAAGGENSLAIFRKDVEDTYAHLVEGVKAEVGRSVAGGKEQIQLVAENPDTGVLFNVPEGPPPEDLELESLGTEDMLFEGVREALFCGLPEDLQEALKTKDLAVVNEVLGNMPVSIAENAVKALDLGGFLSFSEKEILDETDLAAWAEDDSDEAMDSP